MKRGFEGLNGSNPAAQLTWLVLRVVGELSPCSKASLVDRIAGGQPSDAAIGGIVSSVLTKLQEFGFLTVDGDQIAITEDGRNFLEQSPEESDVESDSYVAGGFARLKAIGQTGFAALRGLADAIRKRGDVSDSASAGSARDWVGSLDGPGSRRLVKIGGAVAMVAAFIAGGMMFLERTDAETTDEILLVGADLSTPGLSAAAPADGLLPMGATPADAPEEATQTGAAEPGPQESKNFAALPADPAPPPTADPVPASVQQDAGPAEQEPDPESASESIPTDVASAEPYAEPAGEMGAQPSEMDASAPMTSEIAADGVEPDATVFEQAPADPVVAAIRAKLADPGFGKKTAAEEVAALESFYAERDKPVWVSDDGFSEGAQAARNEIADADSWGLSADAFRLPSASDRPEGAEAQADQELDLALAVLKYARFAGGGRLLPTRVSPLFDQKPQLREPKAVLTEISSSDAPDAYLQSLHPKQEQFHRLRQALLKARAGKKRTATPEVQRLLINMERWRWMPGDLGALYVWSNVPEFNVRVIKAGKTAYVERAIVGQRKYATPLFSASMRSIVFHPDWVVPETIVREDLKPSLQQGGFFGGPSTGILRRHNLQVSLKGRPVEAETVDWGEAKFHQYRFTQPAGPDNVLGELKFNFPNRHAIYMHDTPQRRLFDQTVRTFSHGCIRVREPNRLAALLLAEDKGWSAARIKAMLEAGRSTAVSLARPVPVHLTYFTAIADDKGNVESFPDIYGIDTRMSALLFAKPAKFDVPVVEAKAEWRPRGGPGSRSTTLLGGIASEISGLFSN